MKSESNKRYDRGIRNLARSMLGREAEVFAVSGYQHGNLNSDKTVLVNKGAAIAGNIHAPRVIVAGLVYGNVTGKEIIIEPQGQIWGDIFTVALNLAPSGKIHGWIGVLDEGTIDLIGSGELSNDDIPNMAKESFKINSMDEIVEFSSNYQQDWEESQNHINIFRQLRAEAAIAILARAEIEISFERRLEEALRHLEHTREGDKDVYSVSTESKAAEEFDTPNIMSQTDPPRFEDEKQAHTTLQETRTQLLEREVQLRQLKYQLRETAAKAQLYQERYLWAKVALETVEKDIESPTDTESLLGKNSSIDGNSNLQSQDRKIEEMSILLIEKDAELKQAQDIAKKLAKRLKQMRQLAAQRIQELEKEIARSHSGDE